MWVPRRLGPIDLRWDAGVYYILGTSLAQGKGYRLLNEPGEIDAVQYPPLLPAIVAVHQLALGTSDPGTVGKWLRLSSFVIFIAYAVTVLKFLGIWLPPRYAVGAALLSLASWYTWFISDLLFPEVWFAAATLLFLIAARRNDSRAWSAFAYVCAVVAYGLRTVGLAGLVVWVLDSLIRRRFRQAAFRAALVLVPVAGWTLYVAAVERSDPYIHPAYAYQRAPYLFYNVSYATNIALRDPFTPEKGQARIVRRIVRNALEVPVNLGETLSTSRAYLEGWLQRLLRAGPAAERAIRWGLFAALSVFGGALVAGGMWLQLMRGETLVPLYLIVYVGALCLTPFQSQYLRYLMPVTPLAALAAVLCLLSLDNRLAGRHPHRRGVPSSVAVLCLALLIQTLTALTVYTREHQPAEYTEADRTRRPYRLFFYDEAQRGFDEAVDYLAAHAEANDVVAAGMPHRIYLRTGLKSVMPPFEADAARAQALLDTVPVRFMVVGADVAATERYTAPVVRRFADRWTAVYATRAGGWTVYQRRMSASARHTGGPHGPAAALTNLRYSSETARNPSAISGSRPL
jgi:hypothetical protein